MSLKRSEELDRVVREFVVAREDAGVEIDPYNDETEGGLTDFAYIDADDLTGIEMLAVGVNVAESAEGSEIWCTHDGVGMRLFFGPLDRILGRIRRMKSALP